MVSFNPSAKCNNVSKYHSAEPIHVIVVRKFMNTFDIWCKTDQDGWGDRFIWSCQERESLSTWIKG